MKNWLNDISRDFNNRIYQRRQQGPTTTTIYKWHQEFVEKGLDKKMSFYSYKKALLEKWYGDRQRRLNKKKKK